MARHDTHLSLSALAISPESSQVALGTEDGEVLILDVAGID